MATSILRVLSFLLFISSALCFTPCPLLGPAFPPFTLNTTDKTIAAALTNLTQGFDALVNTTTGSHGDISPNTTFSITLFSSDNGNAKDEPFFWQYHHTSHALSRSTVGSSTADHDSIYRIGGLTEVFTVWSLLLAEDGGRILNDPVTKHLPELLGGTGDQEAIEHVQWGDVTVGQLASHMSGISRDCE
jgi:CubicO group peptidase (beta-lactamase class C family)